MTGPRIDVRIGRVVLDDRLIERPVDTTALRAALTEEIRSRLRRELTATGTAAAEPQGERTTPVASAVAAAAVEHVLAALPAGARLTTRPEGTP